MNTTLSRRLAAEMVGTALLLAVVIGSGIMGERLAGGNTAIALLANTLATGAGSMRAGAAARCRDVANLTNRGPAATGILSTANAPGRHGGERLTSPP